MVDAKEVLNDLAQRLKVAFPGKIDEVVLFGSQLSGNVHDRSDYDFVILWKGTLDWKIERAVSDVCYETDLKFGIVTDARILSQQDLQTLRGKQPVYEDAFKYGLHAA